MPISGPFVHKQLLAAYNQVQANLNQDADRLGQAADQRDELVTRRSDSLVQLAQHYLPELTTEAIQETWSELQPTLMDLLRRKDLAQQAAHGQLQALLAEKETLDHEFLQLDEKLDHASEQRDQVAHAVESALQADGEFVDLARRAAMAETELQRAEANLEEIDQDAARKLPAYRESALFGYLQKQGYGTPRYSKRGFTRRMDRWVAKMINFNKARQSYDFLTQTPDRMRQIIAEDRRSLDVVMNDLEQRHDAVANQHELPKQIQQVQQWIDQRDQKMTQLDRLLQQCDQQRQQLSDLQDCTGTHYQQAITIFRDMLSGLDTADLEYRARRTAEITDDQIVNKLVGVDQQIDALDHASQQQQDAIAGDQEFLKSLGRLIQRFRAAGFDSGRSQFTDSLDILRDIDRARQHGDTEMLWQRLRDSQRWGPTAAQQFASAANHPMTQDLINAVAHAAGGALQARARQAVRRRGFGRQNRRGESLGGKFGKNFSNGPWGPRN